MKIFKLMSEEIFEFSYGKLTTLKFRELNEQFLKDFPLIFELIGIIFEKTQKKSLILSTFETLLTFLSWIPADYIFNSRLLDVLFNYFQNSDYKNETLKCFTKIISIENISQTQKEILVNVYTNFMNNLRDKLPLNEIGKFFHFHIS